MSEFSERLDAIETRANAATAGPWHAFDPVIGYECGECTCGQGPNAPYGHEGQCGLDMLGRFDGLAVDREFIAAARTEVPWLLAELRKAHEKIAYLSNAVVLLQTNPENVRVDGEVSS